MTGEEGCTGRIDPRAQGSASDSDFDVGDESVEDMERDIAVCFESCCDPTLTILALLALSRPWCQQDVQIASLLSQVHWQLGDVVALLHEHGTKSRHTRNVLRMLRVTLEKSSMKVRASVRASGLEPPTAHRTQLTTLGTTRTPLGTTPPHCTAHALPQIGNVCEARSKRRQRVSPGLQGVFETVLAIYDLQE